MITRPVTTDSPRHRGRDVASVVAVCVATWLLAIVGCSEPVTTSPGAGDGFGAFDGTGAVTGGDSAGSGDGQGQDTGHGAADAVAADAGSGDVSSPADGSTADGGGAGDAGCADAADCADDQPCTLDTCTATGCTHVADKDGAACEDGDKCTVSDTCAAGVCTGGAAKDCSVASQCATGSCTPSQGCGTVEKAGACDDGSACTTADKCGLGVCEGVFVGCDDGNSCTDDTCNTATGCAHTNLIDDSPCATKKVCNAGVCVAAGTLYAHTSSTLYKLELKTKSFSVVGNFTFDKSAGSVTDIALDRGNTLYAVTFGDLFVCKSNTAKCSWIMKLPTSFNGLTFVHKGTIFPNHDALIGVANDGGWWHVDYQAAKLTKLGSYGSGYTSSGDAFSVLGVGTFATVVKSGSSGDHLVSVDPKTGKVLKDFGSIGASGLWGFAWWDGVFYGFASNGTVWNINITTGKGSQVSGFTIPKAAWWGAGVSTEAGP